MEVSVRRFDCDNKVGVCETPIFSNVMLTGRYTKTKCRERWVNLSKKCGAHSEGQLLHGVKVRHEGN